MKVSLPLLLAFLVTSSLLFCRPPEDNQFEERFQTTLWIALVNAPNDPTGACVNASKKRNECLFAPLTALGEAAPSVSDETYTSQCNTILTSSAFNQMSQRGQTCVLNCQNTDWTTKLASGECRVATTTALFNSNASNPTVNSCIRGCFQATNSNITNADISRLLIYNYIQNGE